jgi:Protein of unknown function (DUF2889)
VTIFADDPILPADPLDAAGAGLAPLHDREYRVRAYRVSGEQIRIVGAVRDQKPPGLYIDDDPDPLTVHHMVLAIDIAFPSLEIIDVTTTFESFPNEVCPSVVPRYRELIGTSIARGFTHRVRELFGGPKGCTHTTALLQAMAPVAVQCFWSMRRAEASAVGEQAGPFDAQQAGEQALRMILNTCHVWDEHGEHVAAQRAGVTPAVPVFMRARLEALGRDA